MVVGFWKQRAGIDGRRDGREYEILGIGGSWFGWSRATTAVEIALAARLVRPRLDRAHVPGDRRLRQGAAGAAGPDGAGRAWRSRATTGTPTCRRPCGRRRWWASRFARSRRRPACRRRAADAGRRQARRGEPTARRTRSSTRPPASRSAQAPGRHAPPTWTPRSAPPAGRSTRPTGRRDLELRVRVPAPAAPGAGRPRRRRCAR